MTNAKLFLFIHSVNTSLPSCHIFILLHGKSVIDAGEVRSTVTKSDVSLYRFDQDMLGVQEELRHERTNKDKIQREKDQILSEKYSFEQEVSVSTL